MSERFWGHVVADDSGCWLWTGTDHGNGYGVFGVAKRKHYAHRFAYELLIGPIPDRLTLHHRCGTPFCVNPTHVEPLTNSEHQRLHAATQTHCLRGHLYDEANTGHNKGLRAGRYCRTCARERVRARYQATHQPKVRIRRPDGRFRWEVAA